MKFFTAVFGVDAYDVFCAALQRSIEQYAPNMDLAVFRMTLDEVRDTIADYGAFYGECFDNVDNNRWQRVNVVKIPLFREMFSRFPGEDIAWIDVDSLVLADLPSHFQEGVINAARHGKRPTLYDCGDGLVVHGDDMCLGGIYSLPADGQALEYMDRLARQRPEWRDPGQNSNSGDQILLHHLLARSGHAFRLLTDDRRYIYNFETQSLTMHPVPHDPLHKEIRIDEEGRWMLKDRQIVFFYWTGHSLVAQHNSGFSGFDRPVRRALMNLYK